MNWILLILVVLSIAFDAIGDALLDEGERKVLAHICASISILLLLVIPSLELVEASNIWWFIASYTLIRFAIFDYIYNITRKLPLNYNGTTSLYDKFLSKLNPPTAFQVARSVAILAGISIIFTQI